MDKPTVFEPYQAALGIEVLPAYFPIPGLGILPVNAFVLKAAEPVLVDTGLVPLSNEFMENLSAIIDPRDLRWLWLTHTDQDHIGSILGVLEAAYLDRVYGDLGAVHLPFTARLDHDRWSQIRLAIKKGIKAPECSSMGRLFDAMSALIGVRDAVNYEGQAAIELEQMAEKGERGEYPFEIAEEGEALIIDPDPLIEAIVADLERRESASSISARFHNSIARVVLRMAQRIREARGLTEINLSGGVFQNTLLLDKVSDLLSGAGFTVYAHHKVPPNDGGISLGQAYYGLNLQGHEPCV
jgi:metal-dependent hydrolase (beta-lactamase superfamily II)